MDVLLQQKLDEPKSVALQESRQLAVQRLRQLVRDSGSAIAAQIMAASDKRLGTAKAAMLDRVGHGACSRID